MNSLVVDLLPVDLVPVLDLRGAVEEEHLVPVLDHLVQVPLLGGSNLNHLLVLFLSALVVLVFRRVQLLSQTL